MEGSVAPHPHAVRYVPTGRVLGTGGMGRVIEARDVALDRLVAIKVLNGTLASDSEVRRRFAREAVAAAALNHPNVVRVFDVRIDVDPPFIVMEQLPGRTVADEIAKGSMAHEQVRRIGLEMLAALEHAAHAGIVHRDIKPGNLLLDSDGTAKVADFGIAKSVGADLTRSRELFGTPCYLAPEILSGRSASPGTDLYAAGVTMYEMLTGQKPFAADTPWATLAAIQRGERPRLREVVPAIDPQLEAVVERAMEPDPSRRFGSAGEMLRALEAVPVPVPVPAAASPLDAGMLRPDATMRLDDGTDTLWLGRPEPALPPPWWRRRLTHLLASLVGAFVVLVAMLMVIDGGSARDRGSPSPTPAPSEAVGATVIDDPGLERALRELRQAVQP